MKYGKQKLANSNATDSLSTLDRGVVLRKDIFGRNLLHNACLSGNAYAVQQLLANPNIDVTAVETESGSSALHLALGAGSLHCAQLLIRHSRELLRLKDRDGCPAFEMALYYHKWHVRNGLELPSEYFSFGSNTNHTLGFPDSDDRQTPETVKVARAQQDSVRAALAPVRVTDCVIGGYHTAILTSDDNANLYVCGVSSRGRLGLGEVSTQFTPSLVTALASEKVISVGVGRDHTACVTSKGLVYSWGCNKDSQLGYHTTGDEHVQLVPRRVNGHSLKKGHITHVTCSNVHTVCWRQGTSDMYVWGRNLGQMGMTQGQLCDMPTMVALVPGKISAVCASDHYTACIVDDTYIQVYMNGGHFRVFLPAPGQDSAASGFDVFKPRMSVNRPSQLYSSASGPTICVSSLGHVYELPLQRFLHVKPALVAKQMPVTALWVPRRDFMVATHAAVADDGSVIICTSSGSAWKRERKERPGSVSLKEYKFSRIPKVTNTYKVACDPLFRSFAALRYSTQVEQIEVDYQSLELDAVPENLKKSLTYLTLDERPILETEDLPNMISLNWLAESLDEGFEDAVEKKILEMTSADPDRAYDLEMTCEASTIRLPVHSYMLRTPELKESVSKPLKCSLLALVVLHHYLYNDNVLSVWNLGSTVPRQLIEAKGELLNLAKECDLASLVCKLSFGETVNQLELDMANVLEEPGDVELLLDGGSVPAHRFILCRRSSFFDALLSSRWANKAFTIDLRHMPIVPFKLCLSYMYTNSMETLFDEYESKSHMAKEFIAHVSSVLFVADELFLTPLKEFCELVLSELVTVKNVAHLLYLASSYNCSKLKEYLLGYICVNMVCLIEGGFLNSLLEDPELFLDIDKHYRLLTGRDSPSFDWVASFLTDFDGHNESLCAVAPGIFAHNQQTTKQSFATLHRNSKSEETRPSVSPMSSPDLRPHNDDVFEFELDECPAVLSKKREKREERSERGERRGSHQEERRASFARVPYSSSPQAYGKSPMSYGSPLSVSPNTLERRRSSFATAASGVPLTPSEIRFNLKQQIQKDSDAVYWPTLGKGKVEEVGSPASFHTAVQSSPVVATPAVASSTTPSTPWSSKKSQPMPTPTPPASSSLSDLFSVTPPSQPKLSQKERRRLQKQQKEDAIAAEKAKEKTAAEGPWKVKKKAPAPVFGAFEDSTPSQTPSKTSARSTPSRTPSRTSARTPSVPATPSMADIYSPSQLSLAEIRERQERNTQKAKNVKTIEEIQQEETFQKWWDAEVARNQRSESPQSQSESGEGRKKKKKGAHKKHRPREQIKA